MSKKTIAILAIIIGLIVLTSIGLYFINVGDGTITAKTVHEPTKVKIGYREHLLYLPAYVAKAKGYFEEQGLTAELVKFESTNQLVESVLNGNIDAGIGGVNAEVILTIEQKTPGLLKIFSLGQLNKEFDGLLISKDSNIKKISDLEGKTISTLPGTAAMKWMECMLNEEGLIGKVTLVQTNPSLQLSALSSGSVDAVFVLEPLLTIGIEQGNAELLVKSPIDTYFMTDTPFETSVFSADFINQNPDTAEKISKAVDKAIKFINEHPNDAKKYYSDFTPIDDSIELKLPIVPYQELDTMDIDNFQKLANTLADEGLLDEQVQVESMFYTGK